jgi:hypothetical protein
MLLVHWPDVHTRDGAADVLEEFRFAKQVDGGLIVKQHPSS